jgi:hypothetical protein
MYNFSKTVLYLIVPNLPLLIHRLRTINNINWLCGATVARLTPDQKAACSNHVRVSLLLNFPYLKSHLAAIGNLVAWLAIGYLCIRLVWFWKKYKSLYKRKVYHSANGMSTKVVICCDFQAIIDMTEEVNLWHLLTLRTCHGNHHHGWYSSKFRSET